MRAGSTFEEGAEAFFAVPGEGLLMGIVGGVGRQDDPLAVGG